jgi:ectoine hydroxylase-related dioxygenase (phytanoyl-CoA dioxygenase family)
MTTPIQDRDQLQQLQSAGYCVFEQVLDRSMVEELARVTDGLLAAEDETHAQRFRYQGSNISLAYQHPVFPRLFAWPRALQALASLGFEEPKWWSAFLLSKPPHAPPLYWHQDWWAWQDPCSAWETAAQLFLMYYLTDTCRENGCLRVVPGTHRRRIALHDQLPDAHTDLTYEANLDSPLFCRHPDEVEVPVRAGDLVIGDARLLHAAHANQTDQRRTCLTLWYFPAYATLPEPIQAVVARGRRDPPADCPWREELQRLEPLLPHYSGSAEPAKWDRKPGLYLAADPRPA